MQPVTAPGPMSRAGYSALSRPVRITNTSGNIWDPVPTPDGAKIIFAAGNDRYPDLTRDLCSVGSDGGDLTQLTSRPELDWQPAVSPDGKRIAFVVEKDATSNLHLMDLDGGHELPLTQDNAGYWEPRWSPDGKQILCCGRDPEWGNLELWLIAADGSEKVRLTQSGLADNRSPRFTPDGSRIIYVSNRRGGREEIYSIDREGNDLRRHSPGLMFIDGPSVSWDEVAFVALSQEEEMNLYSVSLSGTEPTRLSQQSGLHLSPAYSPDGGHIAYLADDDQRQMQVWEMSRDGTGAHLLTEGKGFHLSPGYMPDGKSLLFISDEDGKPEIYKLPLDGED